jgi:hypothetical protein
MSADVPRVIVPVRLNKQAFKRMKPGGAASLFIILDEPSAQEKPVCRGQGAGETP